MSPRDISLAARNAVGIEPSANAMSAAAMSGALTFTLLKSVRCACGSHGAFELSAARRRQRAYHAQPIASQARQPVITPLHAEATCDCEPREAGLEMCISYTGKSTCAIAATMPGCPDE